MYSVQQQIHFTGNVFGNKRCRCNEGSLYFLFLYENVCCGYLFYRQLWNQCISDENKIGINY